MISLVVGTLSPQIRVLAAVRGDEVQIQRWESGAWKSLWSWNEAGLWFWGFRCLLRFTHWWISFRRCVWTVLTLVFPSLHSLSVLLCHTLTVLCPSPLFLIDGGHGSGRLTDAVSSRWDRLHLIYCGRVNVERFSQNEALVCCHSSCSPSKPERSKLKFASH